MHTTLGGIMVMEEWNPNDYQGRTRQQVETNERIGYMVFLAVVVIIVIVLVGKFLQLVTSFVSFLKVS